MNNKIDLLMSIQAFLHIDDKKLNVLESSYSFIQESDYNGKPSSKPRFIGLQIVIESTKDNNITEWMINSSMSKQLRLQYIPSILGTKTRVIDFIDAHCIEYFEHFDSDGVNAMTITLNITSAGVKEGTTEFSEYWRTTFPNTTPVTEKEEETLEPKVIDYYITDLNNKKIQNVKPDDKILLNIHTKNMIDKLFTINLDNPNVDFKYNGEILTNDTLKDYLIEKNLEKIELEVIKQD